MISPGDIDPPQQVLDTIHSYLKADYLWYPVVGNHEAETPEDMSWLRAYNTGGLSLPYTVRPGPASCVETTYSLEIGEVHITVLNEYADGSGDAATDGDIPDVLFNWLDQDLDIAKPLRIVAGHEPAYPLADVESHRLRHEDDSLNAHEANRDRFWSTLRDHGVKAYLCGHTHNTSVKKINGVWQIDCGHARGVGDTGSRSTFMMVYVMQDLTVWVYTYRLDLSSLRYQLTECRLLD